MAHFYKKQRLSQRCYSGTLKIQRFCNFYQKSQPTMNPFRSVGKLLNHFVSPHGLEWGTKKFYVKCNIEAIHYLPIKDYIKF